jgi:hypothetical protein
MSALNVLLLNQSNKPVAKQEQHVMSGIVAIEWDQQLLRGVAARIQQNQLHLTSHFVFEIPNTVRFTQEPVSAGRWLREQLNATGIAADKLRISLPQDAVVVRHFELPNVSTEQLASLVRMQIATTSPETAENEIVDFLPLPMRTGRVEQDVLAVSIPRDRLESIRKVAAAAGLDLISLGYAPLGIAAFVAKTVATSTSATDVEMVLALRGPRLDILLLCQNQLLFCHTARFNALDNGQISVQAVLAEITRALIAADRLLANLTIAAIRLIGPDNEQQLLQSELQHRFQCSVLMMSAPQINGLQSADMSTEKAGELAVPLGMLSESVVARSAQINLLAPRQPVVIRDRRVLRLTLVSALLLVIAAAAYLGFRAHVHQLNLEKQQRQAELQRLQDLIAHGKPVVDTASLVRDWESKRINWLNEMQRIGQALPGTDLVYLQSWQFESVTGSTVGRIEADGFAARREDVERFNEILAQQPALRILPREIGKPLSTTSGYPYRFDLDIELSMPKMDLQREENQ